MSVYTLNRPYGSRLDSVDFLFDNQQAGELKFGAAYELTDAEADRLRRYAELTPGGTPAVAVSAEPSIEALQAQVDSLRAIVSGSGMGISGVATSGTADAPSNLAAGVTYYKVDANGQVVGIWIGTSGTPVQVLGPAPLVSLTQAAGQSIPSGSETLMLWDTARENTSAMWSSSNPSRVTFPRSGIYSITMRSAFVANSTGTRWVRCFLNGFTANPNTPIDTVQGNASNVSAATPWMGRLVFERRFIVGDYIEFALQQSSTAALAVQKTDQQWPELLVRWVAP